MGGRGRSRRPGRAVCALGFAAAFAGAAPAGAAAQVDDFRFGVVPQEQLASDDAGLMRAGGVQSVRTWFNWGQVEPVPGVSDWSQLDAVVGAAAEEGLVILPYLFGVPGWAGAADDQDCQGSECVPYAPRSELTREAFADFAAGAVDRYGPGGFFWIENPEVPYRPIEAWQVWNEQNLRGFFRPAVDARLYARLLSETADAIRAEDPDAEIVLGGMWGGRLAPHRVLPASRYLRRLYAVPGAGESFDAIAVHPYGAQLDAVFQQVRAARRTAARAGDGDVPLYVTELGWASGGPADEGLVKTPPRQARLLRRAFGRLYRKRYQWNVAAAYWYAWQDTTRTGRVCRWCARSGLHTVSGDPKPAWRAFRRLVRR